MTTYPDYSYQRTSGSTVNRWLVVALIIVLGVLVLRMWDFGSLSPLHDPDAELRPQAPAGDLAADETATIGIFKAVKPSVVNITTTTVGRDFFTLNPVEVPRGTGSGFVWDENGYIVTNFHVIESALRGRGRAVVKLADGTSRNARVVGGDPDTDLAVLKIDVNKSLKPLELGTSNDLQVGQKVFAIGNPFGFDHSLTTGVISGLGREIRAESGQVIRDVIQTDAAINPGNSGGPLLNSYGRLIGVNTAIYSPSGANAGVGFAIPVDTVNRVVTRLIRNKGQPIVRPWIGVQIGNYTSDDGDVQGVMVASVVEGSPADNAGLRGHDEVSEDEIGDIIVAIDGQETKTVGDLQRIIEKHQVGDTVTLTILRGRRRIEVEVKLQELRR